MRLLLIHRRFPGQFLHLVNHLSQRPEHLTIGIGHAEESTLVQSASLRSLSYRATPEPFSDTRPPDQRYFASMVDNGRAVARRLDELKRQGFVPDVTLAHSGWGEALYVKDVFPDHPLIAYCEFYHHRQHANVGFDPEYPTLSGSEDAWSLRTRNAALLLTLTAMDRGVSPTPWQRSLFPPEYRERIDVLHEGVDTERIAPDPNAELKLPGGRVVHAGEEIVTFAARNLEPYRGFHIFLRAAAEICRRRPRCLVLIEGGDGVSYSPRLPRGETYRERLLEEVRIDPDRVLFLGHQSFDRHVRLLQVSAAHVYLTVPFVLSWSVVEAMAAATVVVASDTPPVRDLITDQVNGLLVDFFSPKDIADKVDMVLDDPDRRRDLRHAARAHVQGHYAIRENLARYLRLLGTVGSRRPVPRHRL